MFDDKILTAFDLSSFNFQLRGLYLQALGFTQVQTHPFWLDFLE